MDENQMIIFAQRLKARRIELDMSQDDLADKIGTSKQVISRYETAKRSPKVSIANDIASALGVSINYLFGETENPPTVSDGGHYEKAIQLSDALKEKGINLADLTQTDIERIASAVSGFYGK